MLGKVHKGLYERLRSEYFLQRSLRTATVILSQYTRDGITTLEEDVFLEYKPTNWVNAEVKL